MTNKLKAFGAIILGLLFSIPAIAQMDPRLYTPIDGVPIRQGSHIEWFRGGEMRFDQNEEEAAFVWSDTRNGYRGVYIQVIRKDGAFAFGEGGLKVVDAYGRQEDPQCWPSADGGWFVSWEDFAVDSLGDIYCTKISKDGEILWKGPTPDAVDNHLVPVCVYPKIQEDVRISDDLNGGCIIAWRDMRSGDQGDLYAMHIRGDGTVNPAWPANGKAIIIAPGGQTGHTADRDDAGGMIIAWKDGRQDRNADIWAQRITPAGELLWGAGEGIKVCGNGANQSSPKLCPDGFGGTFISWSDERNLENTHRDIYMQRINAQGNPLWTADGVSVCDAETEQLNNRIILSAPGEAIICWDDKRNAPAGLNIVDIYAARVSGQGAMVKEWDMPQGIPVCINPANQENSRLIGDGAGGAFFVWEDERDGGFPELDLWTQRINANGNPSWAVDGIPFVKLPGLQLSPIARRLADGSAVVVWGDFRSGSLDLYSQKLDPNTGAGMYELNGRKIVGGLDGNAVEPILLSNGLGKAAIVYLDGRQGGKGFVPYVQKIVNGNDNPDLELMIQGQASMILETSGGAAVPDAVLDTDGDVFIIWEDHRPDQTYAIYAQRMDTQGNILWGNTGKVVAEYVSEFSEQRTPRAVADGQGGIIVAWKASTAALYNNLFMQRLDGDGNLLWGPKGLQVTNHDADDEIEGLITDPHNGGAVVMWHSQNWETDNDLYLTRVAVDGTLDANFDKNGDGAIAICEYDGAQDKARLVAHPLGYAMVWVDGRETEQEQTDIYGQVVDKEGNILWKADGWQICGEEHRQINPGLTVDLVGNLWVVWEDLRYTDRPNKSDLFMQKLKPVVTARTDEFFERDGRSFCNATNPQIAPEVLHDGQNGVWVVWEDYRNGLWSDIYGVHLLSDGALATNYYLETIADVTYWGGPVTRAFHKQQKPKLALVNDNGFEGVFVSWEDKRSTGKEELSAVYLQRLWDGRVDVGEKPQALVPAGWELNSAYPNPFNSSSIMSFSIPRDADVSIALFDVTGRKVADLTSEYWLAGTHRVVVDGSSLAAGTYLVKMTSGAVQLHKAIQLLK